MDLQFGGMLYVIFSPAPPPFCSPTHHSQPSPHHPCFHSRLHNHCTAHKGLSSQVQPRLARIKERFQLKMFFPFLLFFFSTNLFPLLSCFPFASHVIQFLIFRIFVAHFSLVFLPPWLISLPIYQDLCQSRSFFSMEKQATLNIIQRFFFLPFALIETRFCPLQLLHPARNPAQNSHSSTALEGACPLAHSRGSSQKASEAKV